jgi:hypothetical protein
MHRPIHILRIFLLFMAIVITLAIIRFLAVYGLAIAAGAIGYLIGRSQNPRRLQRRVILNSGYGKPNEKESEPIQETDINSPYPEAITRDAILRDPRSGARTMRGDE